MIDSFKEEKVLGKGTFSTVHLCQLENQLFACKSINFPFKGSLDYLFDEINTLRVADHPNIVKVYGCRMNGFLSFDLLLEYAENGPISENYKKPNEDLLFYWIYQICLGLDHLHGKKIVHRDLKPSNILLSSKGIIKIADFSLAKFLLDEKSKTVGTISYMPPELVKHSKFTYESDIWSLGISIYELIHGRLPFVGNKEAYLRAILYQEIHIDRNICSEKMCRLLKCMLQKNPKKRKTAKEILEHPIMKEKSQKFVPYYETSCLE